jgi:hypothetical protein
MGIVTLTEFLADLDQATKRTLDPTRAKRWVNQAMEEFGYAFKFRELEATGQIATVAGTEKYALANDFRMLHENGVWIHSPDDFHNKGLVPETRRSWRKNVNLVDSASRGIPTHYHIYASEMYFRLVPDIVYAIKYDYWKELTLLVGNGDVSPFQSDWDDIIFTGALYRAYRGYGEFDRYQNVRNDFLGMIRSRVLEEDIEPFPEGGISVGVDAEEDLT